ncbi:MAG: cytochrome oxidase putative small subunit CydP [Rhodanobacter sp.]
MPRSALPSPSTTTATPVRPLRRLTFELFVLIALKITLLLLIWWFLFAPQPKPDVSPAAISRLLAPTPSAPAEAQP